MSKHLLVRLDLYLTCLELKLNELVLNWFTYEITVVYLLLLNENEKTSYTVIYIWYYSTGAV